MGSSCSSKNSTAVHTPALDPPVAQQPTNGTTVNTKKHVEINSNVTEIKHTDSNRIEEETSQIKGLSLPPATILRNVNLFFSCNNDPSKRLPSLGALPVTLCTCSTGLGLSYRTYSPYHC